jgi:transposase
VRAALVETRAQYITTIRGLARAAGILLPTCEPENFTKRLASTTLDETTRHLVEPLTQTLLTIEIQLAQVEEILSKMASVDPIIGLLATAPGVGLIVAATFVSVVDQAKRFRNAHSVGAYLGLVPGESTTGGPTKRRLGSITKQGNRFARSVLIQASWCILRMRDVDDPLRKWADHIRETRGAKIAVVALARKLAGVLWAMWRDGTVYDSAGLSHEHANGVRKTSDQQKQRAEALERSARKLHRSTSTTKPISAARSKTRRSKIQEASTM